jgi:hypothetical protein
VIEHRISFSPSDINSPNGSKIIIETKISTSKKGNKQSFLNTTRGVPMVNLESIEEDGGRMSFRSPKHPGIFEHLDESNDGENPYKLTCKIIPERPQTTLGIKIKAPPVEEPKRQTVDKN